MKKNILFLIILVAFKGASQQENTQITPISEIKVNGFNLIVYKAVDISYEYLLNENQSLGIGLLFKLKPLEVREERLFEPEISYSRKFSITPYYRRYFSKKYAKGFFIEGFAMYATGKNHSYRAKEITPQNYIEYFVSENYNVLRFGLGMGVKMVSRKNISIDLNVGVGINLSRVPYVSTNQATRGGISLGYRF